MPKCCESFQKFFSKLDCFQKVEVGCRRAAVRWDEVTVAAMSSRLSAWPLMLMQGSGEV